VSTLDEAFRREGAKQPVLNHRHGVLASPVIETQKTCTSSAPGAIDIGIAPSSVRARDELAIRTALQQNRRTYHNAGLT
jgi:hypothetical protein